jgi:hypothetical protein
MQTSPANIAERVPAVAVAKFHPSVGREPVIVFNFAPNIKIQICWKRTQDTISISRLSVAMVSNLLHQGR